MRFSSVIGLLNKAVLKNKQLLESLRKQSCSYLPWHIAFNLSYLVLAPAGHFVAICITDFNSTEVT
jgi:hypothetical protein